MNTPASGWIVMVAALGMMASLLALDVAKLGDWQEMYRPAFVAIVLAHFGAVVTAFIGGKLLPNDPQPGGRRGSDPPAKD